MTTSLLPTALPPDVIAQEILELSDGMLQYVIEDHSDDAFKIGHTQGVLSVANSIALVCAFVVEARERLAAMQAVATNVLLRYEIAGLAEGLNDQQKGFRNGEMVYAKEIELRLLQV